MKDAEQLLFKKFVKATREAANSATDYYEAAGRTKAAQRTIRHAHPAYNVAREAYEASRKTDEALWERGKSHVRKAMAILSPFDIINQMIANGATDADFRNWLDTFDGENAEEDRIFKREARRVKIKEAGKNDLVLKGVRKVDLAQRLKMTLYMLKGYMPDPYPNRLQAEIDNLQEGRWSPPGPVYDDPPVITEFGQSMLDDNTPTCPTCGLDVPGPHPPAGTDPHTTPHIVD